MFTQEIFISICYHKPSPIIRTNYMVPVHVGRALAPTPLADTIGDDTGPNISEKNPTWSELTGLYWMWKNVSADYYGLMHYRRVLNFSEDKAGRLRRFTHVSPREYKKFGWTDAQIKASLISYDIITAPLWNVHPVGAPHLNMSNYAMYAREHNAADMDVVEHIVARQSPEVFPFFVKMLTERRAFFFNIMILRSDLFHMYCKWLFNILEAAEEEIDVSQYDSYQRRVWGFMAERLANAYVSYAKHILGARVCRKPVVLGSIPPVPVSAGEVKKAIERQASSAACEIKHASYSTPINMVLAIDDAYAPHAAVTILSAIKCSRDPRQIRFFILEGGGITRLSRDKLSFLASSNGTHVEFVTVERSALAWLPMNRDHISIETYYRLVMHEALPENVKKVIYIDADTVVVDGLERLWSIDIQGKPIGACPDEGGVLQSRRLRLSIDHRYFNAGVIVFDLEQIRRFDVLGHVMAAFRAHFDYVTLQDQDLLNIIFCNDAFSLPLRWNVNARIFLPNELEPSYTTEEALEAARAPGIIHFTDRKKPWNKNCKHPLRHIYWEFRNETPWSQNIVQETARKLSNWLKHRPGTIKKL